MLARIAREKPSFLAGYEARVRGRRAGAVSARTQRRHHGTHGNGRKSRDVLIVPVIFQSVSVRSSGLSVPCVPSVPVRFRGSVFQNLKFSVNE